MVYFLCQDCIYLKKGYMNSCSSFSFKLNNDKVITWNYTKYVSYHSTNVRYVLICSNCDEFCLGETGDLKQRLRKHKSNIYHLDNSMCKRCSHQNHSHFPAFGLNTKRYSVSHSKYGHFLRSDFFKYIRFWACFWNGNHSSQILI